MGYWNKWVDVVGALDSRFLFDKVIFIIIPVIIQIVRKKDKKNLFRIKGCLNLDPNQPRSQVL